MCSLLAIHFKVFEQRMRGSFDFNGGGFLFGQFDQLMFNLLKEFDLFFNSVVIYNTAAARHNDVVFVLGVQQQVERYLPG